MDNERYNEIVTTYSPMVYRIALHDCRNHADAEDVMQNVFLRLYRFAPEFQSEEHLRRWLIQVRHLSLLLRRIFHQRDCRNAWEKGIHHSDSACEGEEEVKADMGNGGWKGEITL